MVTVCITTINSRETFNILENEVFTFDANLHNTIKSNKKWLAGYIGRYFIRFQMKHIISIRYEYPDKD